MEEINFDILAEKANVDGSTIEDKNQLFGAAFSLPNWHFIARGEFPNVYPYIAGNADVAGGENMIRAFTDTARLSRFAEENNLPADDFESLILSIPTADIVEYLEQFRQYGVYGVWFNSDSLSSGFFVPLQQLRLIKTHLQNNGWPV